MSCRARSRPSRRANSVEPARQRAEGATFRVHGERSETVNESAVRKSKPGASCAPQSQRRRLFSSSPGRRLPAAAEAAAEATLPAARILPAAAVPRAATLPQRTRTAAAALMRIRSGEHRAGRRTRFPSDQETTSRDPRCLLRPGGRSSTARPSASRSPRAASASLPARRASAASPSEKRAWPASPAAASPSGNRQAFERRRSSCDGLERRV
jgi:hypothetical protein